MSGTLMAKVNRQGPNYPLTDTQQDANLNLIYFLTEKLLNSLSTGVQQIAKP